MTWTRAISLVPLAFTVAVLGSPSRATAQFCAFKDTWEQREVVPVLLHPNLLGTMQHVDGTPWSAFEIEQEVKFILRTVSESYANVPHFYLEGWSQCGSTYCRYPRKVHIEPEWASDTTRRHGVEGTFDPKSLNRVVTWRADNGEIYLQMIDQVAGFHAPVRVEASGKVQVAYDTPSVACGDWSDMNCILVWAGAAERGTATADPHVHTLRWMQSEAWPSGDFVLGDVVTEPYLLHGPPRVSWKGSTINGDFVLAYPLEYGDMDVDGAQGTAHDRPLEQLPVPLVARRVGPAQLCRWVSEPGRRADDDQVLMLAIYASGGARAPASMARRLLVVAGAAASILSCTNAHSPNADILDGGVPIVCGEIAVCPSRYWPDGGRLLPYCSLSCDAAAGYDPPICRGSEVPDAEVPWSPYCPSGATPFCAPPRPERCGE